MEFFAKKYHPPGTSPGTLSHSSRGANPAYSISLIDYSKTEFTEQAITTAEDCQPYLNRQSVTWIDVTGEVSPATLMSLGEMFGLHALALEDVLNTGQRPKIEEYDDQLFIVMSSPRLTDNAIELDQTSIFCGENYIVSFHSDTNNAFSEVRKRLRGNIGRLRKQNADYLLYALIDTIIDQGFPLLERFGEQLEEIEEQLLAKPNKNTLNAIHLAKRELLLTRKALWPQREVVNYLVREEHPFLDASTKLYFRDCYDHTVQIIDLLETYRDMTAGMLDVYLSSVSHKLNEVMKVLTLIATIFMPLTFIVGVYGMNFGNKTNSPWAMPELNWYYGYPLVWLLMILIAGAMIYLFKRRHWF